MELRLILGRAGSGKSRLCLQEITGKMGENLQGPPLIYIVPEQATFQAESALFTLPGLKGSMRAQVFSFRRLAWRIMQEVGGSRRVFIDDTGKGMILQKLMEKLKGELKVFKNTWGKEGSLENLVQLYNELKRSQVSVSQLREKYKRKEAAEKGLPSLLFKEKLSDLITIFEIMDRELEGYYLDAEDYLGLLASNIPRSAYLKEAEIWADDFYSFTNREKLVLQELLKCCSRVNVTICLGRDYSPGEKVDELDPFYPAALTCQKLKQLAVNSGFPVKKTVLSPVDLPRFATGAALGHLEKHLHSYPAKPFQGPTEFLPLSVWSAPNRRAEIEGLARELVRLARDEGCRWREMAVLTGDLDQYRDLLSMVFMDYNIPFFLDQERPVLHHPLIEFIRSALEVINGNWRYDALFRCIKTEFPLPLEQSRFKRNKWRKRADRLENYVLAFGIQGYRWLQEEDWGYRLREGDSLEKEEGFKVGYYPGERTYLKLVNAMRRRVSRPLIRFQENFRAASTVKEKTLALFELLQDVGVGERLEIWKKEALQKGVPKKAREDDQVYDGIIGLLDQLVEIMGGEKISAALYARILEAGLKNQHLSLVPPALDQVLVGTMQRTRVGRIKFAFLVGVNDGVLPSRPGAGGVFSDAERETLIGWGLDLPPGGRRRLLDEQFLTYMALTRAPEGLWISYPLANEEGKGLSPSLLIARLKELFPGLKEMQMLPEPAWGSVGKHSAVGTPGIDGDGEILEPLQIISYIDHPRKTLSRLLVQLGRYKKGKELHPLWWDIYNWYAEGRAWRGLGKDLLRGVFYQNRANRLGVETSLQLYQKRVQASASRLERYSACPFSHFLSYGLRLKERRIYRLDNPDIGRFFHAALKHMVLSLQQKGLDWGELSREECKQLTVVEVERLIPLLQQEILLSSSRYRYLAEKLKETVGLAAIYLGEQARRGSFRPVGVEVTFGPGSVLPPMGFMLENGCSLELHGRIDRVDLARDENGKAYVSIIDYKSGNVELDLFEVYHGLSLQIFIYLDLVLTHSPVWLGEEVLPAGVFYFRIHAPLLSSPVALPPEKIEEEMLKRYKLKGRVIADPKVVALLDGQLESGYSKIIPVGMTAQKGFYKNSALLTADHFELLRSHIHKQVQKIAQEIVDGCVDINPYRLGQKKACTFCPYKAVCQFDLLLEGNSYRFLRAGKQVPIRSFLEPAKNGGENENG